MSGIWVLWALVSSPVVSKWGPSSQELKWGEMRAPQHHPWGHRGALGLDGSRRRHIHGSGTSQHVLEEQLCLLLLRETLGVLGSLHPSINDPTFNYCTLSDCTLSVASGCHLPPALLQGLGSWADRQTPTIRKPPTWSVCQGFPQNFINPVPGKALISAEMLKKWEGKIFFYWAKGKKNRYFHWNFL